MNDELTIEMVPPTSPGEMTLIDVVGYAGTQATIATGEDYIMALETALVNLGQLQAVTMMKLADAKVSLAQQQLVDRFEG